MPQLVVAGAIFLSSMQASPDVQDYADRFGLDPVKLQGAVNTLGVDAYSYLLHEGLIVLPGPPLNAAVEARLDCIQHLESHDTASATNRRSGAMGLFQFLPGTWRSTPQGQAGMSAYDPVAARS